MSRHVDQLMRSTTASMVVMTVRGRQFSSVLYAVFVGSVHRQALTVRGIELWRQLVANRVDTGAAVGAVCAQEVV